MNPSFQVSFPSGNIQNINQKLKSCRPILQVSRWRHTAAARWQLRERLQRRERCLSRRRVRRNDGDCQGRGVFLFFSLFFFF